MIIVSTLFNYSSEYVADLPAPHAVMPLTVESQDFHEGIPGFEFTDKGARDAKVLRLVTKSQLTHQLGELSTTIMCTMM